MWGSDITAIPRRPRPRGRRSDLARYARRAYGQHAAYFRKLYGRLLEEYQGEERPQYQTLVENVARLATRIRQVDIFLGEALEKGELERVEKLVEQLARLSRQEHDFIRQLQRHTESVHIQVDEMKTELHVYQEAFLTLAAVWFPEPQQREAFLAEFERVLRRLRGEAGAGAAEVAGVAAAEAAAQLGGEAAVGEAPGLPAPRQAD